MADQHWTAKSLEDYEASITMDLLAQFEDRVKTLGIDAAEVDRRLGYPKGAAAMLTANGGPLTLQAMIKWAQELHLKVSLVAYDDGDAQNTMGPVNSALFRRCWEDCGMPRAFDDPRPVDPRAPASRDDVFGPHYDGGEVEIRGGLKLEYDEQGVGTFIDYTDRPAGTLPASLAYRILAERVSTWAQLIWPTLPPLALPEVEQAPVPVAVEPPKPTRLKWEPREDEDDQWEQARWGADPCWMHWFVQYRAPEADLKWMARGPNLEGHYFATKDEAKAWCEQQLETWLDEVLEKALTE